MATQTPALKPATTPSVRITDPWTAMRQEMNELFNNVWGTPQSRSFSYTPAIDVVEKDNSFELRMDIPGMNAADIEIQTQGNLVTISGHRQEEKEEKGKTFHRIERRSGSFARSVTLPCDVSEKEAVADYTNGVLSVVLPKCEKSRPSKISIRS